MAEVAAIEPRPVSTKPPYRVPTMAEIADTPPNGLVVASTFAGCGGSSLGWRMAGYTVRYANDVDQAARASYEPNKMPGAVLDGRSIRDVKGAEVLEACGGRLDVLDGSPPCTCFSTAGRREEGWGKSRQHAGTNQRVDDLFFEYLRLVDETRPRAFVAENVSGMIKGVAKGYFLEVMEEARRIGYRVKCKLLDAQWLGVPQARQRVIFVGLRGDLFPDVDPPHPRPMSYRYSLRDACPWIVRGSVRSSKTLKRIWKDAGATVSPTVSASQPYSAETSTQGMYIIEAVADMTGIASVSHPVERRKFTIAELRRICSFPDDFVLVGTYAEQWTRLGNSVPPLMMRAVAESLAPVLLRDRT